MSSLGLKAIPRAVAVRCTADELVVSLNELIPRLHKLLLILLNRAHKSSQLMRSEASAAASSGC